MGKGGGGTSLYALYRYICMALKSAVFQPFGQRYGIDFDHFGLK